MPQQLHDGDDDGVLVGQTAGKVGFYGATPISRPTVGAYTTTTAATSTTPWGFASSTQADAINSRLIEITAALRTLGLGG